LPEDTAVPEVIAFVGLGMMGLPMALRLVAAGFRVQGADISQTARDAFAAAGGTACNTSADAAAGASILITMLPDGKIVRDTLLGSGHAVAALLPDALVIDMSSSAPIQTRTLSDDLAALGVGMIDAPVSGGVRRAVDGSLAIMVGGDSAHVERARPHLSAMGKSVIATGPVGSGHAVKALNNFVSAAGLQAACEAAIIADAFGVDPAVLTDVLNVSTGRNNSTEVKMKPFILSGAFNSGFSLALMTKDLRTAADLASDLGVKAEAATRAADLWADAHAALGPGADHTEIYRHLAIAGKG
jgi:3-hydroxyisobutyrate dehydrogenase